MSRCFPFRPTGYTSNGSCSEALIESIKPQREDANAEKDLKKERRREKKEKKERRRERREKKAKSSHFSDATDQKHTDRGKTKTEINKEGCVQKLDDSENEQQKKSDITVEHDQPVSWLEPCSSDSIQSGNKRKRSVSPSSNNRGTGIKLRLALKKPEDHRQDDFGSTSRSAVTADSSLQNSNGTHHQIRCSTSAERDQCAGSSGLMPEEKLHSDNGAVPKIPKADKPVVSVYDALFQNWVSPPLTVDESSSDEDWLFGSKHKDGSSDAKRVKTISGALRCSSPSLWPRAQYLPEVEIYALPYTVPF